MAPIDLRALTHSLLNLTGLSIAELARRAELHRPNLVAWLGGKQQVMAHHNQLKACEALGWRHGKLRRDVLHRWWVAENLADLKAVLRREPRDSGEQIFICSTTDGASGKEFIILSAPPKEPPLVILLRRPLEVALPKTLSAAVLGLGKDMSAPHAITDDEWNRFWSDTEVGLSPGEYLKKYARALLADCEQKSTHTEIGRKITSAKAANKNTPFGLIATDAEKEAWLALLEKAKARGLSYAEITKRLVKSLLGD